MSGDIAATLAPSATSGAGPNVRKALSQKKAALEAMVDSAGGVHSVTIAKWTAPGLEPADSKPLVHAFFVEVVRARKPPQSLTLCEALETHAALVQGPLTVQAPSLREDDMLALCFSMWRLVPRARGVPHCSRRLHVEWEPQPLPVALDKFREHCQDTDEDREADYNKSRMSAMMNWLATIRNVNTSVERAGHQYPRRCVTGGERDTGLHGPTARKRSHQAQSRIVKF